MCSTDSMIGIFNLIDINDAGENIRHKIYYVKYTVQGSFEVILPTLKDYIIFSGGSEDAWNKTWKELSNLIEPCTEEEYYSFFTKTIDDIMK